MDLCPEFTEPIISYKTQVDPSLYHQSVKQFEEKKFEESFRTLMNYINKELSESCEKEKNHWEIPHGSLVVDIRVTADNQLKITAPFLKLPAERRTPMLRQICEHNARTLTLSQITLQDEELRFSFSTPLDRADPLKVWGIISEICINGDSLDDEYIREFGAVPLRDKEVKYLPEETVESAWQLFQAFLQDAMKYEEYYSSKRWEGFSYDILGINLMKIDYVVAPQGFLRSKLEKSIHSLWARRPTQEVIAGLRRDYQELTELDRKTFAEDFYESKFFIHARRSAEIGACQQKMAQRHSWADQDRARRGYQGVVLNYLFAAYNTLYSFFVPDKLLQEFHTTLAACGNKPWEEAADIAWQSFQRIMDPAYA